MAAAEVGVTLLKQARAASGMTQGEVRAKLKAARRGQGKMPPKDASLKRMYTEWELGRVSPTDWCAELCEVFGVSPATLGFAESGPVQQPGDQAQGWRCVRRRGHLSLLICTDAVATSGEWGVTA
ncbi:helix-turn-helix transcriptional regulator [Saccharopolyspora sp. 6V]|uniref:helix-turn-helix domain-containing protein n=1 Tax=Saccharopolyspora sp. 6V TaxID=2877239 RepID=UPI001CD79568|nr:helix-turn-helix transcriptional regulator [Saccharopolyspora sp. 6V]MCA1194436.1 helix-turn-helix domain-containing protein [Saccharopolyspora sp. 6V]